MTSDLIKRIVWFFFFAVAQAIMLGRIHLFGYATPLFYVYFVAMFPLNYPKWGVLLWSFLLGLVIDTFSNTPGLTSASLTLIAAIQPYYFQLFVPRDSAETLEPSLTNLGRTKYAYYIVTLVLFYCMVFFTLELFNFFDVMEWALYVVTSTLITLMLIYTIEVAADIINHGKQ